MKVLMVTRENAADKRFGVCKSLLPLIDEFTHRGIEVRYLSLAEAGQSGLKKLRFIHAIIVRLFSRFFGHTEFSNILWGLIERLNMGRLAAKVMTREKYTHVHCHDPFIATGFYWFAHLYPGHSARWGLTEHGFGCYSQAFHEDGARLATSFMRRLRRWESKILLKAHWVLTPTNAGLHQLARDLSIYPIPRTWHPIPHPRPCLNRYSKQQARASLHWEKATTYIVAVGRFVELKQFPFLIESCALLQGACWELVIIGEGDREPLLKLAKQHNIAQRVEFALTDDIGLYYSAADIYVSTSRTESFGLANLEALVMGLPSICTTAGGVAEVLEGGAWLIPPAQQSVLVSALQTLLDNPAQATFWSEQAKQRVNNWPPVSRIADMTLRAYRGETTIFPEKKLTECALPPAMEWHNTIKSWNHCPLPQVLELAHNLNILLIAPHPDDETLGCGGTLALLKKNNCRIKVVIVTDGNDNSLAEETPDVAIRRQDESREALSILGISDILFLTEPDGNCEYNKHLIKQLDDVINEFKADWIFSPSVLDCHRDHCAIGLSVLSIWQKRLCQQRLFVYEIWTPLPATWVVDISSVYEKKQQAIQCYKIPLKHGDYAHGFTGLMMYRSLYLGKVGHYAEAFMELDANSWKPVTASFMQLKNFQHSF